MSALSEQPGGSHYKDKAIQPVQYIHANGLGFCEGNVVKYVSRWREKNGLEDLLNYRDFAENSLNNLQTLSMFLVYYSLAFGVARARRGVSSPPTQRASVKAATSSGLRENSRKT